MTKRHVFIVGSSRSGTTAFARLMAHHGQIVMGIERYSKFASLHPFAEWGDEVLSKEHMFDADAMAGKHSELYDLQRAKYDEATWVGDKVPSWINRYAEVRARFPEAEVFCTLRDPAAVGLSYQARGEAAEEGFWVGKTFKHGVKSAVAAASKARVIVEGGDPRFHIVEYDRLFPYDRPFLATILAQLDLAIDQEIDAFYSEERERSERVVSRARPLTADQADYLNQLYRPEDYAVLRAHALGDR